MAHKRLEMQADQEDYSTLHLHKNIRILRKEMKMSQEELARRIGLNRGNIASYENGSAEPKICNLLKLSRLFCVSVFDLTNRDLSSRPVLHKSRQLFRQEDQVPGQNPDLVEKMESQAEQMGELIKSVRTCCQFHFNNLNGKADEMSPFMVHFEQLHDAANALLCNHKALIQMWKGERPS